ncbi:MAG TPA: glycosyltransferase family 39 protein [Chloroflexota bacterium]
MQRRAALAAIVVVAFALRVWGLTWGLYDANVSRRPHPDEWPVYWLFKWFGSNHDLDPCPKPGSSCFFDWGTLYPYTAYAVHAIVSPFSWLMPSGTFGPHADTVFVWSVLAGRITSALLSTLTVVLVYRLAAEAYGPGAGLIAAAVAAVSGLMIQLAHFATPDSLTGLLMTGTLLAALLAMKQATRGRFALAGAAVGLSVGTEYHMALLAVPVIAAWVISGHQRRSDLLLALGSAVGAYLLTNIYLLIHPHEFLAAMKHTLEIRTVDSQLQYGDRWAPYGPPWLYVVRYPLGYGVGFALAGWMILATLWAALKRERADLLFLSWLVVYLLLVSLSPAKFMRYSAPLLPVLAVLSGRLAADLFRFHRPSLRSLSAAAAVAALVFSTLYDGAYASLFTSPDPRISAMQWLSKQDPTPTRVAFEELPNGLINLPYYASLAGAAPCFAQFTSAKLPGLAPYIMVDNYDLEEHPRIPDSRVTAFRHALTTSGKYQVALTVHAIPSFLGIKFSIDGSPHDWRYPSHEIVVYEERNPKLHNTGACFASVQSAAQALYDGTAQG